MARVKKLVQKFINLLKRAKPNTSESSGGGALSNEVDAGGHELQPVRAASVKLERTLERGEYRQTKSMLNWSRVVNVKILLALVSAQLEDPP